MRIREVWCNVRGRREGVGETGELASGYHENTRPFPSCLCYPARASAVAVDISSLARNEWPLAPAASNVLLQTPSVQIQWCRSSQHPAHCLMLLFGVRRPRAPAEAGAALLPGQPEEGHSRGGRALEEGSGLPSSAALWAVTAPTRIRSVLT